MSGVITRKDIITDEALKFGETYAKNVQVAIDKNEELTASTKGLFEAYKKLKTVSSPSDFKTIQAEQIKLTQQGTKAYEDQGKALAKVDEERQRSLRNLLTVKNRLQNVNTETNKELIKERENLRQSNLEIRRNLTFMGQLVQKRDQAKKSLQEFQARQALGKKLSDQEQNELKQSVREFQKYDKAVKDVKKSTNEFQENVGNYPKQFSIAANAFRQLLPAVGIIGGLKLAFDFAQESVQLARDARGVEFAFQNVENRTLDAEAALIRIKKATRGLLSDLEIKRAIVDLDNFNIGTEQTDTLLEFLAVRAAQTGQSIDSLRDSLVEGLSKESKLRIDNLGISAAELNEELEKTPNFVEAVANIAKKEITEAGDILDEATNSQQKFNAALEDFKVSAGSGFIGQLTNEVYDLGVAFLSTMSDVNDASEGFFEYFKNLSLVSFSPLGSSIVKAQADVRREQQRRIPIIEKIIELEREQGKSEGLLADKKEFLLNIDSQTLKVILKNIRGKQDEAKAIRELTEEEKRLAAERAKQQKDDKNDLAKSQLEANIEANKAILEDEKSTLLQKQIANINYSQQRQALLDFERDIAIEANKGRTDKLEQIETEYTAKLTAIEEERQANVLKFIEEDFNTRKKAIDEARQAKEDALNAEIALEQEKLQATDRNPEDVEAYEKAVLAIRKKYALETVQVQIDVVKRLLDAEGLTVDQRAELQRQLSELKQAYSDIETDHIIDNNKKQLESEKELQALKQQIIRDSSNALAETLNIDAENLNVFITNIADGFDDGMQDVLSSIGALAGITGDIMNGVYEANIANLENQMEASENYYNRQFELAQGDARQQDLIRIEQEQKRVELEEKIKKEKVKQAKANKAAAIIQAAINTALAVTSALTFAPPASFVMAALAAALGIAQIAIIASQPIPQYAKGTEYHPGGLAEVAEVRPEVIHEPNKKPYIQRKRAVLNLAEGTKVYSSVEDFNRQMQYAAIMSSIQSQKNNLSDYETALSFDAYSSDVVNELRLTRKAIRESKSNIKVVQNKIDLDQELFRFKNLNR